MLYGSEWHFKALGKGSNCRAQRGRRCAEGASGGANVHSLSAPLRQGGLASRQPGHGGHEELTLPSRGSRLEVERRVPTLPSSFGTFQSVEAFAHDIPWVPGTPPTPGRHPGGPLDEWTTCTKTKRFDRATSLYTTQHRTECDTDTRCGRWTMRPRVTRVHK